MPGGLLIDPGSAANSVRIARLRAGESFRMPPISTSLENTESTALLGQWVDGLLD